MAKKFLKLIVEDDELGYSLSIEKGGISIAEGLGYLELAKNSILEDAMNIDVSKNKRGPIPPGQREQ